MTNITVVNHNDLKDWDKEIITKNNFQLIDISCIQETLQIEFAT